MSYGANGRRDMPMIVVDAGFLIALLDAEDALHAEADALLDKHIDEPMTINPINLAEVLVRPATDAREEEVLAGIRALGITTTPLPDDAPARLARLRARTRAKMPDCCLLLTAQQVGAAAVASFDRRLCSGAASLGFEILR